jgi:hypothetical protein
MHTALATRPAPAPQVLTLAVVEALDQQRGTPSPPPRGRASDALGQRVLDLLWRPLEEDDDAGIWQRMQELRAVFDAVPDGEAGALLARLAPGGNLQRDFDYRLHRASRRRLRAGLRARMRPDPKDDDLPVTPIPPASPITGVPPHVVPPITVTPAPDPQTGLSPQFIVGWKWQSERRKSATLNQLLAKVPVLERIFRLVEPYFRIEAIPRVRAAVPGHRVVETKLLFERSGLGGEIEAELGSLPGSAKFTLSGGQPSLALTAKGKVSRFEFEFEMGADGVLGAARGLLPDGPPLAQFVAKTNVSVDLGTFALAGVDAKLSVECEISAVIELRWSMGGLIREIVDRVDPWDRLKKWARGAARRLVALWGRRIWWVIGAGLVLWWAFDDDDPPPDDIERFDPGAWRDAHDFARRHAQHAAIRDAIDEAADGVQESFGVGLADTLQHLRALGSRASAQLETMASGPYAADHGLDDLPPPGAPFDRWFAWVQTANAVRARRVTIDMGTDDWRARMRTAQRVAMAAGAARACGKLSRAAWITLLAKVKWHANAAGIACTVQFLRAWRDAHHFAYIDEKGKRQQHDGARYLADAFKLVSADKRSDAGLDVGTHAEYDAIDAATVEPLP